MKTTRFTRWLLPVLCVVLIAAEALCFAGCSDKTPTVAPTEGASQTAPTVLGKGKTVFPFTVTDVEGKKTAFEIHTDKTTVGEALQELKLIEGEEAEYGLYVKTVNGITLDYDKDKKYWAFYENGNYAATGVDKTNITAGSAYAFKAE